jgi:alpha-tubulin suppressor-like RCC1 family protein
MTISPNRRLAVFSAAIATAAAAALVFAGCGTSDLVLPRDEPNDAGPLADVATTVDSGGTDARDDAADAADGSSPDATEGGVTSIGQIAAGKAFACIVRSGGTVWCWGSNQYGELGALPSAADQSCGALHCSPIPRQIPGLVDVGTVAAGESFACALKIDGTVWCWGRNGFDELGHSAALDSQCADPPDAGTASRCNATPTQVTFPSGVRIGSITTGREVGCALSLTDGAGNPSHDVYCWGSNSHDSAGVAGGVPANVATPNKVTGFSGDVVAVDVGDDTFHVCAIRQSGEVWCWGDDFQGRIGVIPGMFPQPDCGGNHCTAIPQQVHVRGPLPADAGADAGDIGLGGPLTGAVQVKVGSGTSCVLRNDGLVWCWGNNGAAGLANAGPYVGTEDHPGARPIGGIPTAVARLTRHYMTTFATDVNGTQWGWGDNSFGTIPTGTLFGEACSVGTCVAAPTPVPNLTGFAELAAGEMFFVARKLDGTVVAWGRNDFAQLGHAPSAAGDLSCSGRDTAPCNPSAHAVLLP